MGFSKKFRKALRDPAYAMKGIKKNIDVKAGKLIYKNTAGFQQNRQGEKTKQEVQKSRTKIIVKEHEDTYSSLKNEGMANLECPFDDKLLKGIIEKYNNFIEDDKHSTSRSKFQDKIFSRILNDPLDKIPELKDLLSDKIQKMIKGHYQGNFQVSYFSMWRNYHIPPEIFNEEEEIFANHWHCDTNDTSQTILFTNLMDVTNEHGPLEVQSIKRTKELVKMGFGNRNNYNLPDNIINDPHHIIQHIGPAGSTMWARTMKCFHRATNPTPGKFRDMMQIRLIPSVEPYNDDWPDEALSYQK